PCGAGLADEVGKAARESVGQRHPASPDADEDQVGQVLLALGDLVRHPIDQPMDPLRVEDPGLLYKSFGHGQRASSLWASALARQPFSSSALSLPFRSDAERLRDGSRGRRGRKSAIRSPSGFTMPQKPW